VCFHIAKKRGFVNEAVDHLYTWVREVYREGNEPLHHITETSQVHARQQGDIRILPTEMKKVPRILQYAKPSNELLDITIEAMRPMSKR